MSENDKMNQNDKPHLYLVDGYGYIFRAYHALPPLTRKRDSLPSRRRDRPPDYPPGTAGLRVARQKKKPRAARRSELHA